MNILNNVLPIVIIVESLLAGVILFFTKQYGSAIYWIAAGTINFAAVFLIKKWG